MNNYLFLSLEKPGPSGPSTTNRPFTTSKPTTTQNPFLTGRPSTRPSTTTFRPVTAFPPAPPPTGVSGNFAQCGVQGRSDNIEVSRGHNTPHSLLRGII